MDKEEILNKYIDLIDKGYCCDCNELNCIDNFPHAKITHAIRELQQENKQIKEKITDLNCYLYSGDFKSNFESINNEVYIRAKIKDIIGLSMSEEEFGILKNKYYKIDIRPSFTTRKLKKVEEQLNKIKKLIGAYDEVSSLEKEIESIIGDSNVRQ